MPTLGERVAAAVKSFQRPPTAAPVLGEIAFADPRRLFPGTYNSPYNPSVFITKKGMRTIDLIRADDQVKAAMKFKKSSVLSTDWTVRAPESYPPEWEVVRFVDWSLRNLENVNKGGTALGNVLFEILSALDYGFSVTEKIWQIIDHGPFAGRLGYRALKARRPHEFDFDQDEYGNIKPDGILQRGWGTDWRRMPLSKFVVYSYDEEFQNPYGRSDLEAAYRAWWTKDNAYKWLAILLERLGIPPIFALYNPNKYTPAQLDELKTVMENLQAATSGILPRADADALELWAPELAGQATRVFTPSLEMFNKDISRALLMPGQLGLSGEETTGSLARARVQFDVFILAIEIIRRELAVGIMQDQIIKPLVDANYVVDDYPTWEFLPMTDDVRLDILESWLQAVDKHAVVRQPGDEEHIRELLKFPDKVAGMPAAAPPPPQPFPFGPGMPDLPMLSAAVTHAQQVAINYAKIEKDLDRLEAAALEQLRGTLGSVRDDLVSRIQRRFPDRKELVDSVDLRGWSGFQEAMRDLLRVAFEQGGEALRTEMPARFAQGPGTIFSPVEALRWLSQKALAVSGLLRDRLLEQVRLILLNSLRLGEVQAETIRKLRDVFEPYVGDPTTIRDRTVVEPHRLETIIRTNTTEAFNQGRLSMGQDSKVREFIRAWRYSAVLDGRTTEVCRFLDDKLIPADEPMLQRLAPPNHHNALVAGTRILTAEGWRPIEAVAPGMLAWTHRARWRPIYALMGRGADAPTVRVLHLATGRVLRITDEHPVLTTHGWQVAGELKVGDVLFQHGEEMARPGQVLLPNPEDFPSPRDEAPVAWSIIRRTTPARMILPVDLQGNAVGGEGEVNDRAALGVLEYERHAGRREQADQGGLGIGRLAAPCRGERHVATLKHAWHGHRVAASHAGGVSRHDGVAVLPAPPGPMAFSSRSVHGRVAVRDRHLSQPGANGDAMPFAPSGQHRLAESEAALDRPDRLASLPVPGLDQPSHSVSVAQVHRSSSWQPAAIVSIADVPYKGSVWNLGVEDDETYLATGVIVHNCRSLLVPVVVGVRVDEADMITPSQIGRAQELAGKGFM